MTEVLGPQTALGPLVRSLRERGLTVRVVPAGVDRDETLARFGDSLRFPGWYGHNYDALFDCLLAVVAASPGPVHVVWDGTAGLRRDHPDVYDAVLGVLDDTAAERGTFSATILDR